VKNFIISFLVDSRGSAIVEYALLSSLIGLAVITAISLLGDRLGRFMTLAAETFL
jgi:Flp pilus assembly pilin Flp